MRAQKFNKIFRSHDIVDPSLSSEFEQAVVAESAPWLRLKHVFWNIRSTNIYFKCLDADDSVEFFSVWAPTCDGAEFKKTFLFHTTS